MNLLKNPSFELGWTDDGNRQVPNGWDFWYAPPDFPNWIDSSDGAKFSAPEMRHLTRADLPESEHADFFFDDSEHTLKIFAPKWKTAYCELSQPVTVQEDYTYRLTIHLNPDIVDRYDDDEKIPAPDPASGQMRLIVEEALDWFTMQPFLSPQVYTHEFTATFSGIIDIGAAWVFPHPLTGGSAVFTDAWELVIIEEPKPEPEPCRGTPREQQYARTYHVLPLGATWEQASGVFKRAGFDEKRTVGYSYDDAGVGDLDDRTAVLWGIPDVARAEYSDWYDKWYPGVEVKFFELPGGNKPEPPKPPPSNTTKVGFHLQRPFDGCLDLIKRCADAGKPMAWVKVVQEHLEIIEQIRALSPDTKCLFRYIPAESPNYFMNAADYWTALDSSTFRPMFARAVELGYDAVETPINEVIGTHNPEVVKRNVAFDSAYCYWCRDRSGDRVAPAIITPGGGNPDHGYETSLLILAAEATIATDGILVPHTYFPVRPELGISEEWMHSAQVQYDYHLRPILSWLPTFDDAGIDVSKLRFVFGECGAVGANINAVGLPGGYKDAGAGWRRHDALSGDLPRCVNLLVDYEALCHRYPQIEGWVIFTQGYVGWEHFQFNEEFSQLFDVLLGV